MTAQNKWPKTLPLLTAEQERIAHDYVAYWHTVLPSSYGILDRFNHSYPVRQAPARFERTLEIGAGLGEHLRYEKLSDEQRKNYLCLDLRDNMVEIIHQNFPDVRAIVHDCQKPLTMFPDHYFDRVLAIHVLEHLPDLPAAIREVYRLINKEKGVFSVVIPCEGGFAYTLSRRISAQRIFELRYKQSYRWFIEREHINLPDEILEELSPYFQITNRTFFPFSFLPTKTLNLVIGFSLKPRPVPLLSVR
jgi:ubiquinone/menaquinone biosynthesis C-methylase UbiE